MPGIDELLRSAAERAAAATITPPLSAVRRRHTRRRAAQTGAGSVVALAVVTAATLALRTPTAEPPAPSPAASASAGQPLPPSAAPSAAAMQTAMVRTTSRTTLRFQVPVDWQVTDAHHCMTRPFAVVVVPFERVGVRYTPPRCPTETQTPRVLVHVHSQLVGSFLGCGGEGAVRTIEMTRAGAIDVRLGPVEKGRRCVSGGSYELQLYVHADTQDGPEPVLAMLRTFERQP